MFKVRCARVVLLVIGIACLVVFFSLNAEYRLTPDGEWSKWAFGFTPSPWFVYDRGPHGLSYGVRVISASWLFGAAAAAAFWLRQRFASHDSLDRNAELVKKREIAN